MALEIEKRNGFFKTKEIWFADFPYDVEGCHGVVFMDCKNKVDINGFRCLDSTTLVIDLSQDLDAIWNNMKQKSCRYPINRAIKEKVQVRTDQDYGEFHEINRNFRRWKGLSLRGFSLKYFETLKKYSVLFTARLDGEIMAGQLYLEDKDNIRLLLAASKRSEVDREQATLVGCANRLMIWEAIKYAKEKGIKEFDFGGYYTGREKDEQKEGVNIFKKSFGGKLTTRYIYRKGYSEIYKLLSFLYFWVPK